MAGRAKHTAGGCDGRDSRVSSRVGREVTVRCDSPPGDRVPHTAAVSAASRSDEPLVEEVPDGTSSLRGLVIGTVHPGTDLVTAGGGVTERSDPGTPVKSALEEVCQGRPDHNVNPSFAVSPVGFAPSVRNEMASVPAGRAAFIVIPRVPCTV